MSKKNQPVSAESPSALFDRVAIILEQARGNVVRAVNTNMVRAYWLIGREIVMELQGGEERAEYGKRVLEELSIRLNERYGKGFSEQSLQNFRRFYLAYYERIEIPSPTGRESDSKEISSPMGRKSETDQKPGTELPLPQKSALPGDELSQGFSPQLTWSHYRALMRVDNLEARDFYEREAIEGGWDKRTLERQIQSLYYERMLKSSKPAKMLAEGRQLSTPEASAVDALKNPYVLEFLGLQRGPKTLPTLAGTGYRHPRRRRVAHGRCLRRTPRADQLVRLAGRCGVKGAGRKSDFLS